jgi:hypothetical protein
MDANEVRCFWILIKTIILDLIPSNVEIPLNSRHITHSTVQPSFKPPYIMKKTKIIVLMLVVVPPSIRHSNVSEIGTLFPLPLHNSELKSNFGCQL